MLEENLAQWKKQYTDQARQEAIAEGIGLALRDLLEYRFGSIPDSVTSYIDTSSDSDALRKFALFAAQAESLQAVIDRINKNHTLS
ncbi:MAG: hypothetical protein Q3990_08170 [Desulfovibrionaceae bacterium]|nr:hypothetical protein [Desulfovibrionaceae bacterium]